MARRAGMRRVALSVLLFLSFGACLKPTGAASTPPAAVQAPARPAEREVEAGRELFAAAKVEGVFVLRSLDSGAQIVTDATLAGVREVPASTFKVPNALIALERGVLAGADTAMKWDGKTYEIETWNHDHTLASALRDSVVWYFQEVARQIGPEAMRAALAGFNYGTADIGSVIDRFWIDGPLRISPREQVEFMARLHARTLPIAPRHMALVEHMITREQAPGWSWRGKTGLGDRDGKAIGWLVGTVERDGRAWAYALMVRAPEAEIDRLIPLRPKLARSLLEMHGALPPT